MSRNLILDSWLCRAAGLLLGTGIALNACAGDTSVTVGNATVTVTGSSTMVNFPVTRSGDLSYDAYLSFQTQDGTAASGADYSPLQGSWLLPAGVANLIIPVAVNGRNAPAPADKTFFLAMTGLSKAAPNFALAAQQEFPAGSNPSAVAVADVNGDGKPDLIVADYDSGKLTVLLNTTTPGAPAQSFAAGQTFSASSTLFAVAIADMNGDGKPDLIASDLNDGTISVLLNTTTPGDMTASFATAQPFTAQTGSAAAVAVADLNGDGKPDLLIGSSTNAVTAFINDTATDSTTVKLIQQSIAVGSNASSLYVATADLDGDGKPDLVVTDSSLNNTVSALINTTIVGSQSPSFGTPVVQNTGNGPLICAAADVNGDGKPDLIVVNGTDGTLSVFLNATTPAGASFAAQQIFAVAGSPRSVIAADTDGDGRSDLIVGYDATTTTGISVLINKAEPGAAVASFAPQQTVGTTSSSYFVAAADLNGDGRPDVIAKDSDDVIVFLNATTPGGAPTSDLSATSLAFGNQGIGTTSAAQTVTLSNSGDLALNVSITATGPFTQSNTCGTSVVGGASCTLSVTFTPTAVGSQTGSITITDNAAGSPQTISLSGTGVQGVADLSAISLAFGDQNVGTTSVAQVVTLTNSSSIALSLNSIAISGTYAQTNTCGTSVAAGASCTLSVTFTPTALGAQTGSITLTDNAADSPQTVSLSGTGVQPVVSLSPTSLNFGNQTAGTTSPAQTVTLTNTGNGTLTGIAVSLGGNDPDQFAQTNTCGTSIAAGASCTISVTFTPVTIENPYATINISDNADNSPQTMTLTGTGTGALSSLSPSNLIFSGQPLGTTSAAQTLTLMNMGNIAMNITSITADGPFAETDNCGSSVAARATCTISVTYTPTGVGGQGGGITVTSDAINSPEILSLTGTGIGPLASVWPASLTFSSQPLGTTSVAQTVTLTNGGSAALSVSSIVVSGPFAQTNTCGASLAAGASCTLSVTFTPTEIGAQTSSITITDNAADSPQTVSLSGTGLGAVSILSPVDLQFSNQAVGTSSAPQTTTLTNIGNAALSIASFAFVGASDSYAETNTCGSSVAAGASCTISVTFTPTSIGANGALLIITDNSSNAPNGTQSVGLLGTIGTGAVTSLSPSFLAFGNQSLGTTSTAQTVTLTNTGNTALSVTSIAASGSYAQTNTCGSSVAAGAQCTISVTFTPTAVGTQSGGITVTSNAISGPQTVNLSGTGTGAVVDLSSASLVFASQQLNTTSAAQTITLTNSGNVALNLSNISASGAFAQTNTCTGTIAASGGTCTISVTFTPTVAGAQSGSITLTDNAADSPQTVVLSGIGGQPAVTLSLASLTFATTFVGTTTAAQSVTLTNSGSSVLNLSIAASGPYAQTNTCGSSVATGANCTLSVTFTPTAIGTQTGSITLTDNAADSPQTVSLSGTGKEAVVTLSQTSAAWLARTIDTTSATRTVTITNTGNATLGHPTMSLTGSNPGQFAQTNTCTTNLGAGGSCTVTLTFTPTSDGPKTAILDITDTAADSPQTVTLSASGLVAGASLSPSTLSSFGNVIVGNSSTAKTVTLSNSGGDGGTLSSINVTLTGTNANQFTESDSCSTLAEGASCTITVKFVPTSTGSMTAALHFTYNGTVHGGASQNITLTGSGVTGGGGGGGTGCPPPPEQCQ